MFKTPLGIPSRIVVLVALMVAVNSCFDEDSAPTTPNLSASSDPVRDTSRMGDPRDWIKDLEIDWPANPPAWFTSDADLVEAVRESNGLVFVGFTQPGRGKLVARANEPAAGKVNIGPVSAASIRAGRAFLEEQGARITMPFRRRRAQLPGSRYPA